MSTRRFEEFQAGVDDTNISQEGDVELNLNVKLERRRRIEEIFEAKRLREELDELDFA